MNNEMKYVVSIRDPYNLERIKEVWERFVWLKDHVGPGNYRIDKRDEINGSATNHIFSFADCNHAMLFKLTWGGK
jgi:hypothetical protein